MDETALEILRRRALVASLALPRASAPFIPLGVGVVCNHCGQSVWADTVEQLVPALTLWTLAEETGGFDYCPGCVQ